MAVSPAFKKVLGDIFFKLLEDRPVLNDFQDFGINIRNYRTVNFMRIIWMIVEVDGRPVSKHSLEIAVGSAGDNDFEAPLSMPG